MQKSSDYDTDIQHLLQLQMEFLQITFGLQ